MYRRKPQGWVKHIDFILLDICSLLIAFALSFLTRYGWKDLFLVEHYLPVYFIYMIIVMLLHVVNNTFSGTLKRGYYKEFVHTVKHVFTVEMIIVFYLFALKQSTDYSRIVIVLLAVYYILISYVLRLAWKWVIRTKGIMEKSAAMYIVSTKDRASAVVRMIKTNARGEYCIQGLCILDADCTGETVEGVPVVCKGDDILEFVCDKWVDEIYFSLPPYYQRPDNTIDRLTEMGIVVHVEMDKIGSEAWQIRQIQTVAGQTVQTISITNVSTRHALEKRIIDIVGGIIGCLITALLAITIGPLIYIHSPGPIFFSQIRVGKNGKKFKMYKFRSMYLDAEEHKAELLKDNRMEDGMMFKLEYDPRIIGCKQLPDGRVKKGIGNFIREYSLDEFPQFFNVLKGDLSICGTRPPTVDEWEKYKLHHRARLSIKPGITGLWQVSGRSNITNFEEVVELDKKYIREWSIGMDLRIILKTILVILRKDGSM